MARNSIPINGARVQHLRKQKGLSQLALARATGLSPRTIEAIEESTALAPKPVYANTLQLIAGVLEVLPESLAFVPQAFLAPGPAEGADPARLDRLPRFHYGDVVPEDKFVDRADELLEAEEVLLARQSFLLVGSPRAGKTSFCRELQRRLMRVHPGRVLAAYLNLQFYPRLTVETFLENTVLNLSFEMGREFFGCEYSDFESTSPTPEMRRRLDSDPLLHRFVKLVERLQQRTYVRDPSSPPRPLSPPEFLHYMKGLLQIFHEKGGRHCVLLHDEANHLDDEFSESLLTANKESLLAANVSSVFAASPEMAGAFERLEKSFGVVIHLPPFSRKEHLVELLQRYWSDETLTGGESRGAPPITADAVDLLWVRSRSRPYLIQLLAHHSFRAALDDAAQLVTRDHVERGYERAAAADPTYFADPW